MQNTRLFGRASNFLSLVFIDSLGFVFGQKQLMSWKRKVIVSTLKLNSLFNEDRSIFIIHELIVTLTESCFWKRVLSCVCRAMVREIVNNEQLVTQENNEDFLNLGLSSLHHQIRSFLQSTVRENCVEERELKVKKKLIVQNNFRFKLGWFVDCVKRGKGIQIGIALGNYIQCITYFCMIVTKMWLLYQTNRKRNILFKFPLMDDPYI